ncbi:endonuclease [Moritella viscosa]|uniref:endonuclease n=1 Tax=Moritella viscosa TaxID=80854 RepID=UPI001FCCF956|nr:endonuclease [Moritella viscosa]
MVFVRFIVFIFIFIFLNISVASSNEFKSFSSAKKHLAKQVNTNTKTIYCGCSIKKQGKKLVPDPASCGYVPRNELTKKGKVNARAKRIEWEHIVAAADFGSQLQCWQYGGRKNCKKVSAKFRKMEADINNLAPAIGEINADRSNYRFGMIEGEKRAYGACDVEIDFKQRVIEPPPEARKRIAEAYFYMQRKYGLKISKKQKKLFEVWIK